MSTTVLISSTYGLLIFPNSFIALNGISALTPVVAILGFNVLGKATPQITTDPLVSSFNFLLKSTSGHGLIFIYWLFFLFTIIAYLFILTLLLNSFLLKKNLHIFINKLFRFLRVLIVPNLPFFTVSDLIISFLFFFFTLYFLELHFFFIYLFDLSSDTTAYTFNFLLSSFFFIFCVKFVKNTTVMGIFFSVVSFFFVSTRFTQSRFFSLIGSKVRNTSSTFRIAYYLKYSVYTILFILFFFSTFLVWLLRYIIQFIRLFVLYMIHMVFEQIIISSDHLFSINNQISFFFFKSIFFFFFYFEGFCIY